MKSKIISHNPGPDHFGNKSVAQNISPAGKKETIASGPHTVAVKGTGATRPADRANARPSIGLGTYTHTKANKHYTSSSANRSV